MGSTKRDVLGRMNPCGLGKPQGSHARRLNQEIFGPRSSQAQERLLEVTRLCLLQKFPHVAPRKKNRIPTKKGTPPPNTWWFPAFLFGFKFLGFSVGFHYAFHSHKNILLAGDLRTARNNTKDKHHHHHNHKHDSYNECVCVYEFRSGSNRPFRRASRV